MKINIQTICLFTNPTSDSCHIHVSGKNLRTVSLGSPFPKTDPTRITSYAEIRQKLK